MTACPASEGKPRVLIVDDHALSNRVMTLVLRVRGFPCLAVTSESQALATIEEFRPDVVILEWATRLEREVERAARIRGVARAGGRPVAVIVVTHEVARPCPAVLESLDGYFTKPIILDSLEQTILRITAPAIAHRLAERDESPTCLADNQPVPALRAQRS